MSSKHVSFVWAGRQEIDNLDCRPMVGHPSPERNSNRQEARASVHTSCIGVIHVILSTRLGV